MDDDLHKVTKLCIGWAWEPPMVWSRVTENFLSLQRPENSFWVRGVGECPTRRHIDICEKGLAGGASHILFVGSDQIHPLDMIPRLIAKIEQNGCDVITALIPTHGGSDKVKYFQRCAWVQNKSGKLGDWDLIDPSKGDLQRITAIGSGVLMFPTSGLTRIKEPWFKTHYSNNLTYTRIGCMDTEFVHRLDLEAGLELWVDTTIKVKHLISFQVDETFEKRFEDWNDK